MKIPIFCVNDFPLYPFSELIKRGFFHIFFRTKMSLIHFAVFVFAVQKRHENDGNSLRIFQKSAFNEIELRMTMRYDNDNK